MWRKLALFSTVVSMALVLWSLPVSADVNDFTITDFNSNQVLTQNDPQGELRITETIQVHFTDFNHGIERTIPDSYKGHSLNIRDITVSSPSGAPAEFTTRTFNGNIILRIGNPSTTVTGDQSYRIQYTLQNVITFYNDHDELYWDINGDGWRQPVSHVELTLHMPSSLTYFNEPKCFAGNYEPTKQSCLIAREGSVITASTQNLLPSQTLTIVAGFHKRYFQPENLQDKMADYWKPAAELLALPLIVSVLGFAYWHRNGRDPKGRRTIMPEYRPPTGMTAIEAGTLLDFRVDNKDITATIIDLALRRYVKIVETKETHMLRKDSLSYTLELTKADFQELRPYEVTLLTTLFPSGTVGEQVKMNDMKNKFYKTAAEIREAVENKLTADGYFKNNPLRIAKIASGISIAFYILAFVSGYASLSLPILLGLIITISIIWFVMNKMPSRTAKGVTAKEQLLGLKLYLETAEADRIKMLQSPDAVYAANHDAPQKTVELFERLLPFAMVLGVEKQWASQFNDTYTQPPDWYSGNWTAFNAGLLAGSLSSGFQSDFNSAFSSPSSSGSSGFGGGGFSGGGGGGGGGGGW